MAFFRVDEGTHQASQARRPKALPAGPSAHAARKPHKPASHGPASKKSGGGVDLDLSSDADDGEFEKF